MKVIIADYKDFVEGMSNDGGGYIYYTHYVKLDKDLWQVRHSTSADFDYCPCCGTFGCTECDPDDFRDYDLVNTAKVRREIEYAGIDPDMDVRFE